MSQALTFFLLLNINIYCPFNFKNEWCTFDKEKKLEKNHLSIIMF